jgi:hypothetical protein
VGSGRNETVYVCFQREWPGDPSGLVRIGRYETRTGAWSFAYYPLDGRESPNGGWVGLSEIVSVGWGRFLVIERDNQAGTDARIKKIYRFSTRGVTFKPDSFAGDFDVVSKYEVMDLLPALQADNGAVIEKVEGLMVTRRGEVFINTDNDGVDDSSGETQMINLGRLR